MIKNKTTFFAAVALTFAGMLGGALPAYAQVTVIEAAIVQTIYAGEPGNGIVFVLPRTGKCKNPSLFTLDPKAPNYKDSVALVIAAYTSGKKLGGFTTGACHGDRTMLTHVYTTH